jgi:glycolate oxidase
MIQPPLLRELSNIVGPAYLKTLDDDLAEYAGDATEIKGLPDAVAFPGTEEEISKILILANKSPFPVVPRGAGSGKSGGAAPVKGGLVLAMERFDHILAIDQDNLIAKVEPGVITAHLQEEVEKLGFFYPPDPASFRISTIGGNVAECAGGLRAVKYGVTRDYVLGLRVVLPTGEIIKTGVETAKGVVGYDLTRLITGSEGTLAVITSVTLRLIPKPSHQKTTLAFFLDVRSAVRTVSEIIRNKVVPAAIELMDRLSIDCVRDDIGIAIPPEVDALLLIEVDGDAIAVEREAEAVRDICLRSGAQHFEAASSEKEAEALWEARRCISEAVKKLRPNKISEDIVVPRSLMADLVTFLDQLKEKYGLPIPAYGHAGDGNLHVNIMFDRENPLETKNRDAVVTELFRKVIELGGTISGEHGIGATKAPFMGMELSRSAIELMSRLKKAFDPRGILNPGKIFP